MMPSYHLEEVFPAEHGKLRKEVAACMLGNKRKVQILEDTGQIPHFLFVIIAWAILSICTLRMRTWSDLESWFQDIYLGTWLGSRCGRNQVDGK